MLNYSLEGNIGLFDYGWGSTKYITIYLSDLETVLSTSWLHPITRGKINNQHHYKQE